MTMKIQKIKIVLLLSIAVFLSSCNWIDPELNVNPNDPADVPLSLILPSIQGNVAYDLQGNDAVMPTNIWMQYLNGYARQAQIYAGYRFTPADVNNLWDAIYAGEGMDCKILISKAKAQENPHMEGVGQIMMAYMLSITTDLFGDIPYSECFQGATNLRPAVDSQESIYAMMNSLLDSAITNLAMEDLAGIGGDMIHGGDADAWTKTAYALKARFAINLSERNGSASYTAALAALANAYESNDDNMAFEFGIQPTEQSPISQFVDQRGDIVMGKYFMDFLNSTSDPRVAAYAELSDAGTYAGSSPADGLTTGISFPGEFIASQDVPVTSYMMTYAECKFIEAEALLATDADAAADAYKEGVMASLELVLPGEDVSAYYDAEIAPETGSTLTLEDIIMQKYVANFGQVQPYNDYRRTGYPAGLEVPSTATTPLPKRFPYSQDEVTYNPNIEELWQVTVFLTTPVWWDAN